MNLSLSCHCIVRDLSLFFTVLFCYYFVSGFSDLSFGTASLSFCELF